MTSNRSAGRPPDQLEAELAAITSVGRAVNATLSVDAIAGPALSELLAAVRADMAMLFLRAGDRLDLVGAAPDRARERLSEYRGHRVGACICGMAVREGTSICSRDILTDDRCTWEDCKRAGIRSLAAVPLIHGGDVIGVIGLASETVRDFEGQREFLEALAALVAAALVNARLYETTRRELAERQRAEEALRASLREKVVLLKEIHHRVKNNLQIISSLLSLQAAQVRNPEVQGFLADTQGRVRAMAVLHETLYRSDSLARVNLRTYVDTIGTQIIRAFAVDGRDIRLRLDVADVMLQLDQAIPVGLVLNELLSNALKHAFAGRSSGEIAVQLQASGDTHYVLRVADDGIGWTGRAGAASEKPIGLLLVEGLVRQLDGVLTVTHEAGTTCRLVFPLPSA